MLQYSRVNVYVPVYSLPVGCCSRVNVYVTFPQLPSQRDTAVYTDRERERETVQECVTLFTISHTLIERDDTAV